MARKEDGRIRRQDIVKAALEVLNETGLEGVSMRKLAAVAKIQAPSLYWHFPDKQALLEGMADAILDELDLSAAHAATGWRAKLSEVAGAIRNVLLAYRDGGRVYAGAHVSTHNILRVADATIGPLRDAGASPEFAADAALTLFYFVLASTIEEQLLNSTVGAAAQAREARLMGLAAEAYPSVLASGARLFDLQWDDRFRSRLEIVLDGIQAGLARTSTPRAKASTA